MKVLMILEPVGFRDGPSFLTHHLFWVEAVYNAVRHAGGVMTLATNPVLCERWQKGGLANERPCLAINTDEVLADFGGDRHKYAKALYEGTPTANGLLSQLTEIKRQFTPDLVLMTSQNEFVRSAFKDTRQLWLEQSPLPRLGQPLRTFLDPSGHQIGSLLETHKKDILSAELDDCHKQQLLDAFSFVWENRPQSVQSKSAAASLVEIRKMGRIALLATQPSDWVTFEGAGKACSQAALVLEWVRALPSGWVGVPTLHPGESSNLYAELAGMNEPRLHLLPESECTGMTDSLIPLADGMITLTSNCAMSAILLQKPVVITGRSPYQAWGAHDVKDIDKCETLTNDAVARLLAFLTHRYSMSHTDMIKSPIALASRLTDTIVQKDPIADYLDFSKYGSNCSFKLLNLQDRDAALRAQADSLAAKDAALRAQADSLAAKDAALHTQADSLAAKDAALRTQADSLAAKDAALRAQTETLAVMDSTLRAQADSSTAKDTTLRARDVEIAAKDAALRARDAEIARLRGLIYAKPASAHLYRAWKVLVRDPHYRQQPVTVKRYTHLNVPWHTHLYRAAVALAVKGEKPWHTHVYRAALSLCGHTAYHPSGKKAPAHPPIQPLVEAPAEPDGAMPDTADAYARRLALLADNAGV